MPDARTMDGPAVRGKLRSALERMETAAADVRAAIYDSEDRVILLRRALAAEDMLQLALNDLTEVMILANPEAPHA